MLQSIEGCSGHKGHGQWASLLSGKAQDWLLGRILESKLDPNPDQDYEVEQKKVKNKRLFWADFELCQIWNSNIIYILANWLNST